jgi:hypothetical protein
MKNEYLTVNDISKHHQTTSRNVRRIIANMKADSNKLLLRKDNGDKWLIHQLLLPKFKPQRNRKPKYYALTIIPINNHTESEIKEMMQCIFDNSSDNDIEINYTVEVSKLYDNHNHNHIHCYIKCKKKRELLDIIKTIFYDLNYKQSEIYDLDGWKKYITKENSSIITIKK